MRLYLSILPATHQTINSPKAPLAKMEDLEMEPTVVGAAVRAEM